VNDDDLSGGSLQRPKISQFVFEMKFFLSEKYGFSKYLFGHIFENYAETIGEKLQRANLNFC